MALETRRKLCLTREAARIYGCTMNRIRQMAREGLVWSEKAGPRAFVFDALEIERLAKTRAAARMAGPCRGKAPAGFSPG